MLLTIHEPGQTPEPHAKAPVAVGIDLGTTHSVVAKVIDGEPRVLGAPRLLPSAVAHDGQRLLVGEQALTQAQTITSAKRLMGKSYDDVVSIPSPYTIHASGADTLPRLQVGEQFLTPIQVAGHILQHLKSQAEAALGQVVTHAVITVPAYFDDAARQATKAAAQLAGLTVLRLVNEPTAAALAYGLDNATEGTYAVYDLGGGTFDVSILRFEKGVFQVLATGGDTQLGGDDVDAALAATFLAQVSYSDPLTPEDYRRLLTAARQAKEKLSTQPSADMTLYLPQRDCSHRFMAGDMAVIASGVIERSLNVCRRVLADAGLSTDQLDGVVLVGGTTRMPAVRHAVQQLFGKAPLTNLNPDEVVALGAARQAHALTEGSETLLLDVTPLSLGLETMGGIVEKIIHRNTAIPALYAQEFTTYQDGQTAMRLHIVQGERELVADCRSLATLTLQGIPPMSAGAAKVKVTFSLDADGILTVTAQEQTSGAYQQVEVKPSYGLDEDAMRTMLYDSLQHGQEDMQARLLRQAQVDGERLLTELAKATQRQGELILAEEKPAIAQAEQALRDAIQSSSRDDIINAMETVEAACRPFVERRMNAAVQAAVQGKTVDAF